MSDQRETLHVTDRSTIDPPQHGRQHTMKSTRQFISEHSQERRRWTQRRDIAFAILFVSALAASVSVVLDSVSSTVFLATLIVAVVSAIAALVFSVRASRHKVTTEHVDLHTALRNPPPVPPVERGTRVAQPQSSGAPGPADGRQRWAR